jgi:nitroreductase
MSEQRKSEYPVNPLILHRTSPRAMSGEEISEKELMSIFEAGRYAPSAYNSQPWKFLYARKETEEWNLFFEPLVDFNKLWAKNASTLILIVANKFLNEKEEITNIFDSGAAWENMALQAKDLGLIAHAMSGFDYVKIRENLDIPKEYHVLAMIAVGKKGTLENLPENLRDYEVISPRKELSEIVIEGKFK